MKKGHAWWWCALLAGCASASDVEVRSQAVLQATDPEKLDYCPAEELALARSEVVFARAAARRGEPVQAAQHLSAAEAYAQSVKAKSAACGPARPEEPARESPKDGDQDGVEDALDRCLLEREDVDGFVDGDGCPDVDDDGDGLSDVIDKCPRDPEDLDGFEDLDGCPDSGP